MLKTEVRASSSGSRRKIAQTSRPKSNPETNPGPSLKRSSEGLPKARVFVVEDHSFVREELVMLINGQADLTCCGEADSIASTQASLAVKRADLVLLDLRLKDGEAFDLINSLRLACPRLAILVVSQCDELLYAERAVQAGANGYIMKQEAAEELVNAIGAVLAGKVYLSRAMSERLLQRVLKPALDLSDQNHSSHRNIP